MDQNLDIKTVFFGEAGVGESSLMLRFVTGEYLEENSQPTLGAAFLTKTICVQQQQVKFQIWDTAGQEKYRAMLPLYYKGARVVLFMYDVSNPNSYLVAKQWIAKLPVPVDQSIFFLHHTNSQGSLVDFQAVQEFAQEQNMIANLANYKLNEGIQEIFNKVAELMIPSLILK